MLGFGNSPKRQKNFYFYLGNIYNMCVIVEIRKKSLSGGKPTLKLSRIFQDHQFNMNNLSCGAWRIFWVTRLNNKEPIIFEINNFWIKKSLSPKFIMKWMNREGNTILKEWKGVNIEGSRETTFLSLFQYLMCNLTNLTTSKFP